MGGSALKTVTSRRLPREEYEALSALVVSRLRVALPGFRFEVPHALREKEDFGDLDILTDFPSVTLLADVAKTLFNPTEFCRNGPVLSLAIEGAQVDVILVEPEEFRFALNYFSWGDLGMMVGILANRLDFKFGAQGLLYPISRLEGLNAPDIVATRNFSLALTFLGLDAARYKEGFANYEEVYRFITDSSRFHPGLFLGERENHKRRARHTKRPGYRGFLEYLKRLYPDVPPIDEESLLALREEAWGDMMEISPDFGRRVLAARETAKRHKIAREKFNGDKARQWLTEVGLECGGRELGQRMARFRKQFTDREQLVDYLVRVPPHKLRTDFLRYAAPEVE